MGMFDYVTCKYPLPVAGANELTFQTKDTPAQFLDRYEIREDGTVWHEASDDQWEAVEITGEIRFYEYERDTKRWTELSAYFVRGRLKHLEVLSDGSNSEQEG